MIIYKTKNKNNIIHTNKFVRHFIHSKTPKQQKFLFTFKKYKTLFLRLSVYIKISNFIFNQINNNRVELSCLYLANFHLTAEKYVVIFFLFIVNQLTGEEIILNILFFNIKYKKKIHSI